MTYGELEVRTLRYMLSNAPSEDRRFSPAALLGALNRATVAVATRLNPWAGYNAEGKRIYTLESQEIRSACDSDSSPSDETLAELRAIAFPLDSRYADATCYYAAALLLEGADKLDAVSNQYAAQFYKRAQDAVWQ